MLPRYSDTVTDAAGNGISGATVLVKSWDGSDVTLYGDRQGTSTISSTLTTDARGQFSFYAPNGHYLATTSVAGFVSDARDISLGAPGGAEGVDLVFDTSSVPANPRIMLPGEHSTFLNFPTDVTALNLQLPHPPDLGVIYAVSTSRAIGAVSLVLSSAATTAGQTIVNDVGALAAGGSAMLVYRPSLKQWMAYVASAANPSSDDTISAVEDDATDNTAAVRAAVGPTGSIVAAGHVRARFAKGGSYRMGLIDHHRSISMRMDARGGIVVRANDNLPALTPGPAGVGTGGGAESSLFRMVSVSPPSDSNLAWSLSFDGFNIDGRKGSQIYPVHGIRVPNNDPSKNDNDPDPNFAGNKDYVAGSYSNGDIINCSGSGMVVEATNGRLHLHSYRLLNNELYGGDFGGNDIVIDGHSAAGGNKLFGIKTGLGSGFLCTTGNFWGYSSLRSVTTGAMWVNSTKLHTIKGCEFNDWLRIDGANAGSRGGVVMGNVFGPYNELFTADGVAIDMTVDGSGNPAPDPRLQAHIGVAGTSNEHFVGNMFGRSTKVNFATPSNVGGDLAGLAGTAFQYEIDVSNDARTNIIDTTTSAPDIKPWCANDPVPYRVRSGGQANYIHMDAHLNMTRIGARGAAHSKIMLGVRETDYSNPDYAIEIGDASIAAGASYRNVVYGMTEFDNAVQYTDTAWDRRVLTNGQIRIVKVGQPIQKCSVSGGGVPGVTIKLPQAYDGQKASYFLEVIFTGGPITAITWAQQTANPPNTNSILFSINSPTPPKSTTGGYLSVRLFYAHDQDTYEVVSTSGQVGTRLTTKINSAAPITLTNNVPTDIASLGLPPGTWDVYGGTIITGTGATVTVHRAGLSTTSGAIVSNVSDACSVCNLNFVTATGDLNTHRIGPTRVTSTLAAPVVVYLVNRVNFSAGTVTAYGDISAVLVAL